MIWPAYAISVGQLGELIDGVIYETQREGQEDLRSSILLIAQIDPVLLVLGAAGVIYAVIKKDYFILLWAFPYLIFLYFIGWVVDFHWIVLLPLLCIAISNLIENLTKKFTPKKYTNILPYIIVSSVAIFGFLSTIILTSSNLNNSYFDLYLFITRELGSHHLDANQQDGNQGTTIIGSHRTRALIWIPKYIFNDNVIFRETDIPNDNFTKPMLTKKYIIVADSKLLSRLTNAEQDERDIRITKLYYNTSQTVASFIDEESNRYTFMNIGQNHGFGPFIEVRANY
jgi:hypothetical protein